ncbi:hypothetical protein HZS_7091, partial [Henneguya salminicola]
MLRAQNWDKAYDLGQNILMLLEINSGAISYFDDVVRHGVKSETFKIYLTMIKREIIGNAKEYTPIMGIGRFYPINAKFFYLYRFEIKN